MLVKNNSDSMSIDIYTGIHVHFLNNFMHAKDVPLNYNY